MTQQTSGYSAAAGSPSDPSTADVAREQAGQVGRTAGDAGQRVAGTAAQQAGQVGQEARRQARDLLGQAQGQLNDQARNGQQQAREGLHSLARELREMADGGDRHGPASDLAAQAADKLGELADWLGRREPGDLINEVRALARRRPGAFLLGAAAAGVLAGRLTRGAVDAQRESGWSLHQGSRHRPPGRAGLDSAGGRARNGLFRRDAAVQPAGDAAAGTPDGCSGTGLRPAGVQRADSPGRLPDPSRPGAVQRAGTATGDTGVPGGCTRPLGCGR